MRRFWYCLGLLAILVSGIWFNLPAGSQSSANRSSKVSMPGESAALAASANPKSDDSRTSNFPPRAEKDGAESLTAGERAIVDKRLSEVKSVLDKMERSNLRVINKRDNSETNQVVAVLSQPSEEQIQPAYEAATQAAATLNVIAGGDFFRSEVAQMFSNYTSYPMPVKVLVAGVDKKTGKATFSEEFVSNEADISVRDDGGVAIQGGGPGKLDRGWGKEGSWATKRYSHLFDRE